MDVYSPQCIHPGAPTVCSPRIARNDTPPLPPLPPSSASTSAVRRASKRDINAGSVVAGARAASAASVSVPMETVL